MKRKLRFNQGIIAIGDRDVLLKIMPTLECRFTQRKSFSEYYFKETEVELSISEIDNLSDNFVIVLNYEELIINIP